MHSKSSCSVVGHVVYVGPGAAQNRLTRSQSGLKACVTGGEGPQINTILISILTLMRSNRRNPCPNRGS